MPSALTQSTWDHRTFAEGPATCTPFPSCGMMLSGKRPSVRVQAVHPGVAAVPDIARPSIVQVSRLSLAKDLAQIASLPRPESCSLTRVRPDQLVRAACRLCDNWTMLFEQYGSIVVSEVQAKCPGCGRVSTLAGSDLWNRALLCVGGHLDFVMRRLMKDAPDNAANMSEAAAAMLRAHDAIQGAPVPQSGEQSATYWSARALSAIYTVGLIAATALHGFVRVRVPHDLVRDVERSAHSGLANMAESAEVSPRVEQRLLATRMVRTIGQFLTAYYELHPRGNSQHLYGPFSSVRLPELSLLARRAPEVAKVYGEKRVERVFEQQIALVTQSLGFYVVPTREGERSVDLLCISADQGSRFVFLLETKSSRRPYALPARDERALVDYVGDVRRGLPTLGPLHFVLIVGPEPARTLGRRLTSLQSRLGIPVRYCPAREMAHLRELTPSLMPMSVFLHNILESPVVLPADFGKSLAAVYAQIQAAHQDLVRSMLPVRSVAASSSLLGPTSNWPGGHCSADHVPGEHDGRPT